MADVHFERATEDNSNLFEVMPHNIFESKKEKLLQPTGKAIDSLYCPTGNETDIWFMGLHGLDWSTDTPRVISGFSTYNGMDVYEGHTSICDRNGNLLIYTDNEFVYNRYHSVITRIAGGASSSMTMILPQPGQDSIYYIFHPYGINGLLDDTLPHLLRYTIINVKSNNYAGSVLKLNQILLNGSSEKVTGVIHCNGKDWWVIGLRASDEAFHAWLLTDTGLVKNNPIISYSGVVHHGFFFPNQNVGYLKPSHNGSLLAEITSGQPSNLELHKFDPSTGTVYNGIEIYSLTNVLDDMYSSEFSPDNTKLYISGFEFSTKYSFFQFDLTILDSAYIRKSMERIYNPSTNFGSPVLGKDGRIYVTSWGGTNLQHVVHQPNKKGLACDFRGYSFDLGSFAGLGAPLFPAGLLFPYRLYIQGPDSFCADTTVKFILSDPCPHQTTEWTLLDGGQLMNQNGDTIQVYYSDKGNYRIAASYPTNCGLKTDTLKIEVTTCNCHPSISWLRMDTTVCEGDRASFQYTSTSTQVLLNNTLLNVDTFSISNLKNDTIIQLMIKYPRSCDSIININIKVHPSSKSEEQIIFCDGDSVFVDNKWIFSTDTIISKYSNSSGCDSTHSVIIQKIKKDSLEYQTQICEGDSVLVFGIWRYIPEILRENYISSHGCDSIVTYEVKVNPISPQQTHYFSICPGDSTLLNNIWYKDSATIFEQSQNQFGCDSVIENIISVYPKINPTFETQLLCPGDSILIRGKYYRDTITIIENNKNQYGCDSIHSIHIQFHPNIPSSNLKYSFCDGDSVQFENLWITRDSQILRTYPSASLCDSLVIHKFIKLNKSTPTSERVMLCYEDSVLIQNKWYHRDTSIQFHYQNQQACDSIHTIDLVFYPKVQNTIDSISICKGDSILINSTWYYDNGQILQRFSNQFGCDSIKQTQILLRPGPEPVELSYYFCQGDSIRIKNNWYYTETSFTERKSSLFSCDTVISYHLLIYEDVYVDLGQDLTLNQGEVFIFNPTHSSNVVSYKWSPVGGLSCVDCSSPEITATNDMTYFLEVSDKNGCTSLDSITIRFNEIKSDIYVPNAFSPNGDNINDIWMPILSDVQVKILSLSIYDRWGNEVFECVDKINNATQCGWNGMFDGKKCLPGVYVYHVYWKDPNGIFKNIVGDLTLMK
ncbi:MAG: gliding motility-associated C-terminal domain-containing protein [Saprospiraceae bacterium]|nr:gliding motility-associated C-terminal domain-containing protein [Saprospiraceae bacterium]